MLSEDANSAALGFSTAALPARERVPFWREVFGRKLVRVDVEPLANAPFEATATLRAWPDLRFMSCASTAHGPRARASLSPTATTGSCC
jgi:hypothetical protein